MDAFEPLRDLDFEVGVVVVNPVDAVATFGDPVQVFEWASVTKLVTAWAALIAVDEGALSLDDPAGPEGSTLRHLLAHCSGLPFDKGAPIAAPGTKRIYSNLGIEVAAEHVAAATGVHFVDWVGERVLAPLGMETAELYGSPAHGMRGTAVDLAEFARAILNRLLVSPALADEALNPEFADLVGVLPGYGRQDPNPWGLGFEVRGRKDPHWTGRNSSPATVGHFGWSGSFLWVDPVSNLGCVFLGGSPFSEVHQQVWPDLTDRVNAAYAVLD